MAFDVDNQVSRLGLGQMFYTSLEPVSTPIHAVA